MARATAYIDEILLTQDPVQMQQAIIPILKMLIAGTESMILELRTMRGAPAEQNAIILAKLDAKIGRGTTPPTATPAQPLQPEPVRAEPAPTVNAPPCSVLANAQVHSEFPSVTDTSHDSDTSVDRQFSDQSNVAQVPQPPATLPLLDGFHLTLWMTAATLLLLTKTTGFAIHPFDPGGNW